MQLMTKEAIKNLQKSRSHVLTVEDYDLIEQLDRIACELSGVNTVERRLLDSPFYACGLTFYPLTIAKSLWYREKVEELDLSPIYHEALMFWLMTLPNKEGVLESFKTDKAIFKAAKKLARRLHCSPDEMADIVRRCSGMKKSDDGDDERTEAMKYGGLVAVLLKEYGCTAGKWLWETPIETVAELFDQYAERCKLEQDASRGNAAKGGKAIAPVNDARIAMLAKFREKLNEISEIWSEVDG